MLAGLDCATSRSTPPPTTSPNADAYSRDTWAFLAREARERFPAVRDLAVQISESGTPWEAQGLTPPDYVTLLLEQPGRAAQFTRMLHEIHLPLADQLAESLPMDGVERLLDVGGGSGVMSLALLRRHPRLQAVVLDIENVCAVGREIAAPFIDPAMESLAGGEGVRLAVPLDQLGPGAGPPPQDDGGCALARQEHRKAAGRGRIVHRLKRRRAGPTGGSGLRYRWRACRGPWPHGRRGRYA